MRQNKISGLVQVGIIGSALMLACVSAKAVPYSVILNETAPAGTAMGPGNAPPTSEGVQPDTFPVQSVGGHPTLQFALSNNGGNQLVPGDVLIYEDAAHTVLSDVLRFENWGVGYVYVYSAQNDGTATLADTGMPTGFQANSISVTEQFVGGAYGLFGYTPTVGQPGYSTFDFTGYQGYTYNYTSDEPAGVPDGGATVAMLGMGLLALSALKRKLAR